MPTVTSKRNWRAACARKDAYRLKLIAKGVADGTSKLRKLMCRFKG